MGYRKKRTDQQLKTKYKTLYSKSAQKRDEKKFEEAMKSGDVDWTGFRRLMIRDICTNTPLMESGCIGNIKMKDIEDALKCPHNHWKTLMKLSDELMRVSPHYYRLNHLYSNMALCCWWVDLYDVKENASIDAIKKSYAALAARLENMNIKHEFSKIMRYLPYQDVFCGLTIENSTDFFIQKVDFSICKLYQVQDGLYNFIIDLSQISPTTLGAYPEYVRDAYLDWRSNKEKDKKLSSWYLPPADKQICMKLNSQWIYPYPLLIGLVKDLLDLEIYKQLKLQSARTDNYKAILVKVPIDETVVDKPLLTPETLMCFAEINRESMNDDIGMIHTLGSTGEAISFKDSSNTRNNVADAVEALYDASGESKECFNGSSSGTAVTMSVENDSGFVYGVYRQFERWVNRYIKLRKYNKSAYKFYFYMLDATVFNRDTVANRYKDACSLGATVIDKWMAALGMTPSRMLGSFIVHKNIFDFKNNFVPLSSSFNGSAETGRPTNESQGKTLDVEGEKTKDNEKNDR